MSKKLQRILRRLLVIVLSVLACIGVVTVALVVYLLMQPAPTSDPREWGGPVDYSVPHPRAGLVVNSVPPRSDRELTEIMRKVDEQVDTWAATHPERDEFGFYSLMWRRKKEVLRREYSIVWRDPEESGAAIWD